MLYALLRTLQTCLGQGNRWSCTKYSEPLQKRFAVNLLASICVCRSGSVSSDESWDSEKEEAAAEWTPPLNPAEWTIGAMNPLPEEDEHIAKDASSKFLCDTMAS